MSKSRVLQATVLLALLFAASLALAEVKTITATGEYRMGDNDTRTDAKRLALLDAKRLALEQAGIYLESVTEVKDLKVNHDELRAYTAGIIEITEHKTTSVMDGQQQVVRVEVTARIDTVVLARQVQVLQTNTNVRNELLRAKDEAGWLRNQLEAKTRELAAIKSKGQVETVTAQRQQLIGKANANELITKALIIHGFVFLKYLEASETKKEEEASFRRAALKTLARAEELTGQAVGLDPANVEAQKLMGSILLEEGKYLVEEKDHGAARAKFRKAIRLGTADPDVRYHAAAAFSKMGDHADAITEIEAAIDLDPSKMPTYYTMYGNILLVKGDIGGAGTKFRKAIELDPANGFAHVGLGNALKKMGRNDEADNELKEGMRLINLGIEKFRTENP